MTFHRYVALGDSFTEGVGDPDPAAPNGLRGWADRVAEVLATRDRRLRLRQPRDPRPQAATRSSPSSSSRRSRSSPTWSRSTPAATTSCGPRVDIDALVARVRRRARPARRDRRARSCCSPPSTPAARPIYRPAARPVRALQRAGPRDRRPARRRPSSTSGGCASTATGGSGTPTGCTSARPATSGWRSRCSTPSASPHALDAARPPTAPAELTGRREQAARRTSTGPASSRRPVGAPPPHRPLLRRRRRARSDPTLGADLTARARRVGYASLPSPASGRHCGCSSVGRARPSQGRCREFESRHPLHARLPPAPPTVPQLAALHLPEPPSPPRERLTSIVASAATRRAHADCQL